MMRAAVTPAVELLASEVAGDIEVAQTIGFGIIAALMIVAALNVVLNKNVVHSALSLVVVMGGAAAQYLLLAAEFVAVTQVLVYVGAVMVLFLFGVMLTRAKLGKDTDLDNSKAWMFGLPIALLLLGVMSYVLINDFQNTKISGSGEGTIGATANILLSDRIFSTYALPFWALSFILLAAVIGAIVLARKD